jgi:hypothetical protein
LKSSIISSGQNQTHPNGAASRKSFALDGPSAVIDPRTQAVRGDLADIRLADLVFAPHYAAPMAMVVQRMTPLRAGPGSDDEALADLAPGALFEALDFARGTAWGIAVDLGLVGYVDRKAIDPPAARD